ncbi:MAG: peptidoglycan DD-metalloendopeptidase family protein [Halioglobus sp.]
MPILKRPRGATPTRQRPGSLPGGTISLRNACLALAGVTALGVSLMFSNAAEPPGPQPVELSLSSNVTAGTTPTPDMAAPQSLLAAANGSEPELVDFPPPEAPWIEEEVRKGDNLSLIFKRAGYSTRDVYDVVNKATDGKRLERIFPGQTIAFQADENQLLSAIKHKRSALETVIYRKTEDGYETQLEKREPERRQAWASGVIDSSLFLAGQEAGLSQNVIMELANIFGGVIDFILDPRRGDAFHLIYEELYLDGEKMSDGEIVAASFTNRGETFNAYLYTDADGHTSFYNEDGVSMRKAFLMAPVDFTRISSNFNPRRRHPIYKTNRPHRGIDYAAARGTPVFAAGDGRVTRSGYSKSNGNYVVIQHGEKYVTKYLHLNRRSVKKGQRVDQSQVIGTVGSTGAATGPHLHYEFLMNGVHRNPRTIHKKLPKAKSLPSSELARFREAIDPTTNQLAALRSETTVAMSDSRTDNSKP